jgi:hypothetical protein
VTQLQIATSWLHRHAHIALCVAIAAAAALVLRAHREHLVSALPYLLLLACPLLHVFGHHRHRHSGSAHDATHRSP